MKNAGWSLKSRCVDGAATVLARTKLQAHTRHLFDEVMDAGAVSHVRFNIFPDGGVSRLRVFGVID